MKCEIMTFTANIDNTEGSVGFTTMLAPALYPIKLIKVDEATGRPLRDRNGLCITAAPSKTPSFCTTIFIQAPRMSITIKEIQYNAITFLRIEFMIYNAI